MPWQLVYTSSPRTLTPGQSGFGTVARTLDLRDALIQRLEQLSTYAPATTLPGTRSRPAIHAHRLLHVRGSNYHLLSRIVEAPLDFTRRTNHIAHHLVFDPSEIAQLPSPATILRLWDGWCDAWTEEPRYLDDGDWGNLPTLPRSVGLPAAAWNQWTGDAGRAASLLERPTSGTWQLLVRPDPFPNLLQLFAESLQLLDPDQRHPERCWDVPFTTCAQPNDPPGDFRWRAWPASQDASPGSHGIDPAAIPLVALPVPATIQSRLARKGPQNEPVPTHGPGTRPPSPGSDSGRARLRLSGRDSNLSERRDTSNPSRATGSQSVAPADTMTPRMWSVATVIVGLGLLLGGGFLWPGWFRAKAPRPSPQPNPAVGPGQHARPGKADPNPTHAMSSETSSVATGQSATSQESLRSQSLLDKTFDRVPTYLLPTGPEGQAVRVSGIPELEALLARVFGNAADLAQGPIAIRVERDRIPSHLLLDVLPNASTRATFEHFGGKRITIPEPGTSQSLAVIEASQWSIPGANDEVMALFPADQSLGLVFHPVPESPQFEPFRLVAIEGKPPSPVRLPKSFLRPGKTNLLDALDPHLIPRLPQFLGHSAPPESSHFELRPFAGDPPTPLYEAFQSDYPIPPGSELAWDLHRQRLIARMAEAGRDKEKLQKETDKLVSQIETANTNDLALGVLLGIARNTPRKPSPLANLAAFARSRGSEDYPTRSDFLEYLRALLASLKIPCDDLLDATRRKPTEHEIGQLYARLGKYPVARLEGFAQLTPDYFTNRWAQLATVDLLRAFRERLSAASQRGARLGELLHRIPSSLDSLPWIDLNVVDARGRRIEWIRFADSTPPAQP